MAMNVTDLPDLLETTRVKTRKANFTLLDKRQSEFVAYPTMFRKDLVTWAGGHTYEYKVMTKIPDTATFTGPWDEDVVSRQNVWSHGQVQMRHMKNFYVIEKLEQFMNKGEDEIIDEFNAGKFKCMMGLAHIMENVLPTGPADASDELRPYGFDTWFTRYTDTVGFDHHNVTGFPAGRAGIDSTNTAKYSGHANYTGKYSTITYDDLIEAMLTGSETVKFKLPVANANVVNPNQARLAWYCGLTTKLGLAKETRQQNDNVGPDLAKYFDTFLIRGAPVKVLDVLNSDTDEPIFGINHSTFRSLSLRGNVFRESPGMPMQGNHNAMVYWVDCSWQTFCDDLSANMTFIKVAA